MPSAAISLAHAAVTSVSNCITSDAAFASQKTKAPVVESGETSTRCAPTINYQATGSTSPPPSRATRPGTVGRNAGSTTPDVLL